MPITDEQEAWLKLAGRALHEVDRGVVQRFADEKTLAIGILFSHLIDTNTADRKKLFSAVKQTLAIECALTYAWNLKISELEQRDRDALLLSKIEELKDANS